MKENQTGERRKMHAGDWFNSAISLAVGLLLGSAVYRLVQLATTDFWPVAILIAASSCGLFLLMLIIDGLFDRLLTTGIRAARKTQKKAKAPLTRLCSLPTGFVLGAILSNRGLDSSLLLMLP